MKLYNICVAEEFQGDLFTPRIPNDRAKHEDDTIPRICLSSSISGCVSAVPWGGMHFEEMFIDSVSGSESYPLLVCEFDTDDIKEGNLIEPSELYQKDLVRDAEINQEYWVINQELKARNVYFISVTNFTEEIKDCICYKDAMEMDRLDKLGEDYDCEDYIDGCYTKITVVSYNVLENDNVLVDDIFYIPLNKLGVDTLTNDLEKLIEDSFSDCLTLNNSVASVYADEDEIIVEIDRRCSIVLNNVIDNILNTL